MELTIEQLLQKGVVAHKEGRLEEAEGLYRAILQSQPTHPDANHNLGVLKVSVNKPDDALILFKTAIETNPKIEQFWLSYIDALIKEKQFDDAKQVLEKAKKQGVAEGKLNALKAQLIVNNQTENVDSIKPSQEQLDSLLDHYQNGRFDDAEKLAVSFTKEFPQHQFAWKVLGAVLKQTGRVNESLDASQKSVQLAPQDAEAHSNFGVILKELGKIDEAEASYKQAIALNPDYVQAHNNLGIMLQELGKIDEAEASYKQAIALRPDFAEAHNNLGNIHKGLGRSEEAISAYVQAITLKPDFTEAIANFGMVIKNIRFKSSDRSLYPILINLLTVGNLIRPSEVVQSILSLIKNDPLVKDLLAEKNFSRDVTKVVATIETLDQLPLIHSLMRLCPLPDLQFEGIFVTIRRALLANLDKIDVSPKLIHFLSTLSLHCFTNEYVYFESDEEIQLVYALEAKIAQAIAQSEQPQLIDIMCLASYRRLYGYDWCQKLVVLDHLEEVKKRLIEEPLVEKVMMQDISNFKEISNQVSLKVREQYEENPYPRWVNLEIPIEMKSIAQICDDINLELHSENIKEVVAPAILIAGCGTGQQSIGTASSFSDCQVLAVDLSLTSLAYAKRETIELGIKNLEYLHADILNLDQLKQEFDIIESTGVLHHMNKPMAGWKVLTDILKPGGLMHLGLYSELARQDIVKVRESIALQGIGTSEEEIRKFRWSMIKSNSKEMCKLTKSSNFFTISTLRDLIFHEKEYRFNLPQIQDNLDELGLKFCGFENKDIVARFKGFHNEGSDIYDLALWHQFEDSNPDTFAGMYQFWCQKI